MANKRVHYAIKAAGIAPIGSASFTVIHGLQSIGTDTNFNLENILEIGQLGTYEIIENLPDVTLTTTKVLDGYPNVYMLATQGAGSASLGGRSGKSCQLAMNIYPDDFDSASGTPLTEMVVSGLFVNSVTYNFPVEGNFTEECSLGGNDKRWRTAAFLMTGTLFNNADSPNSLTGSGGVNRREDLIYGTTSDTLLPTEVAGISSSGTNNQADGIYAASVQNISVSVDLNREELLELGRKAPYYRFINFPVDVTTSIEIISKTGDMVNALAESDNVTNQSIRIKAREGLVLDLGSRNKLVSVSMGGGDTGGGNDSCTYEYRNQSVLSVASPYDVTTGIRI